MVVRGVVSVGELVVERDRRAELDVAVDREARREVERADPGRIARHDDRGRVGGDPQRLDREARQDAAPHPGGGGGAAYHAVQLGHHRHQAQAARIAGKGGQGRDAIGKGGQRLLHALAEPGEAGRRCEAAVELGLGSTDAGLAQDHGIAPDRRRHRLLIAGQRAQQRCHPRVDRLEELRIGGRGEPVGLGEQDVEHDRHRPGLAEAVDQVGEHRARPGPLADLGQAGIVDVDDRHRRLVGNRPRGRALELVEQAQPGSLDQGRVPHLDRGQHEDQAEPDQPGQPVDRPGRPVDLRPGAFRPGHAPPILPGLPGRELRPGTAALQASAG